MNLDQQLKEPLPAVTPAGRWRLDRARSEIRFGVRKMGLYTVRGRFTSAAGEIVMGDEGLPISAEITVDAASVTTRMPPRDWHLRTRDFLEVTTHPTIRFEADNVAADADGGLRVQALVTIKGLTRRIELRGHEHADPHALRLHVRGELDRHDFDIKPRPPLDSVVGPEVQLDALLVFTRDR